MKIRQASLKDIDKIAELFFEYAKYEHDLDKNVKLQSMNEIKKTDKRYMKLGTKYLLLEKNNEALGVLGINIDKRAKEKIGVLHTLIITKNARGKGYGNYLVKYALNYFKKNKCSRVRTFIHFKNKNAKEFWKKHGFDFELGYNATKKL